MTKKEKVYNLLEIYRNYLFALQERAEYGEKYSDTKEIMAYYEKILMDEKVLRRSKIKKVD